MGCHLCKSHGNVFFFFSFLFLLFFLCFFFFVCFLFVFWIFWFFGFCQYYLYLRSFDHEMTAKHANNCTPTAAFTWIDPPNKQSNMYVLFMPH